MSSTSSINSLLSSASTSPSSSSSIDISSLLAASSGASSVGIDVSSAVDAAVYAAQAPERVWQTEQATLQTQMTALTSIQTALTNVSTDLDALNDPLGALTAMTVTSSDSASVTATSTAGAAAGTHTIVVNNLATTASWYSSPLASSTAAMGSSTLTITPSSGTPEPFVLGTNGITSLASLAKAINSASIGINASVVTDATGSRLALVSQTSGSASNFTVSDGPSASSASWSSADLASATTPLAASTFQVSDGTLDPTITVAAGDTLASVASQINGEGLNLLASVVTDSSGAHLSIAATGSGVATVSADPALLLTQPSTSRGSNASLTVDGIPVSSSSNAVTGVINGLTLNLQNLTSGAPVSLTVAADANQISSALSQFVTDYNSAASLLSSQFTFNTATGSEGALGSDATVRSLQATLLGITGYNAGTSGNSTSSSINTLSDLGITMNNDGSLSLDTATLDQAVSTNATGVQNFFQGTALNGFAGQVTSQLQTFVDPTSNGALTSDLNSMTQQYNDLQTDVTQFESGYIASQRTILTTMYSNAEIALQQLPTTMKEIQAQLGNGNSGG